jgi:cathepsin B
METAFDVYMDFFNYQSGVYVQTSDQLDGGHAVKMLGWGFDAPSGLNYWLCANSWGTSWGMEGFFKIAWGQCGIDSTVYACTPATTTTPIF